MCHEGETTEETLEAGINSIDEVVSVPTVMIQPATTPYWTSSLGLIGMYA